MRLPAARARYDEEDERQARRILEQEVTRLKAAIALCLPLDGSVAMTGMLTLAAIVNALKLPNNARLVSVNTDGAPAGEFILVAGDNGTYITLAPTGFFLVRSSTESVLLRTDATGNLHVTGHLGVGNSAAATTPGSVVKKIEIFDSAGASLGFLAVYSSIT